MQPDVLRSMPVFLQRPLGGGNTEVQRLVTELFRLLLSLNRQIKGLCSAEQTAPSPLATDEMTENKSNRKTRAPSGVQAPSVIAVIPGSFYPSFSCLFLLLSLALILLLKVTAGNAETLRAQVQRSVLFV